jgi:hypothetical protein
MRIDKFKSVAKTEIFEYYGKFSENETLVKNAYFSIILGPLVMCICLMTMKSLVQSWNA